MSPPPHTKGGPLNANIIIINRVCLCHSEKKKRLTATAYIHVPTRVALKFCIEQKFTINIGGIFESECINFIIDKKFFPYVNYNVR